MEVISLQKLYNDGEGVFGFVDMGFEAFRYPFPFESLLTILKGVGFVFDENQFLSDRGAHDTFSACVSDFSQGAKEGLIKMLRNYCKEEGSAEVDLLGLVVDFAFGLNRLVDLVREQNFEVANMLEDKIKGLGDSLGDKAKFLTIFDFFQIIIEQFKKDELFQKELRRNLQAYRALVQQFYFYYATDPAMRDLNRLRRYVDTAFTERGMDFYFLERQDGKKVLYGKMGDLEFDLEEYSGKEVPDEKVKAQIAADLQEYFNIEEDGS